MKSRKNSTCPGNIWQLSMADLRLNRGLGAESSGILNATPRSLNFIYLQHGAMEGFGVGWGLFVILCLEWEAIRNRDHAQGKNLKRYKKRYRR